MINRQLYSKVKPHIIPDDDITQRNLDFYRKLMRHIFAICQLVFEWRTGVKPPGVKDLLG